MSGAAPHTMGREGELDRGSTSDLHGPLFTPTQPSFVVLLARRTTAVWRHSRKAQTVICDRHKNIFDLHL